MGELQSDFCKNLTEFYQISLKNLPYLTDFSPQLMACMNILYVCVYIDLWQVKKLINGTVDVNNLLLFIVDENNFTLNGSEQNEKQV